MPELAEIECLRVRIANLAVGRRIARAIVVRTSKRQGVTAAVLAGIRGKTLDAVERRGKLLIFRLSDETALLLHCGMSGRLVARKHGNKHDLFCLAFRGGVHLTYNDFRRFGRLWRLPLEGLPRHAVLRKLGPEPLSLRFSESSLASKSRRSVKSAILDQSVVAGLGNIYACESLYRARISPERAVGTLTRDDRVLLVRAIKHTLRAAIARGGSTLADYRGTEGEAGDFETQFAVFGRDGLRCPSCKCDGNIVRVVQNGRSTYFCPVLQK